MINLKLLEKIFNDADVKLTESQIHDFAAEFEKHGGIMIADFKRTITETLNTIERMEFQYKDDRPRSLIERFKIETMDKLKRETFKVVCEEKEIEYSENDLKFRFH